MSQQYYEVRYRQVSVALWAAVIGLIVSSVLWFSGIARSVADPWVKWPFRVAAFAFALTIINFAIPTLELRMTLRKHQYPYLTTEQREAGDKQVYAGIFEFVVGVVAFIILLYRLTAK